jgi:hypothetical protein
MKWILFALAWLGAGLATLGAELPEVAQLCLRLKIGTNSNGSGFFFVQKDQLLIVTAKHVIYNPTNNILVGTNLVADFIWPVEGTNLWRLEASLNDLERMKLIKWKGGRDVLAIKCGIMTNDPAPRVFGFYGPWKVETKRSEDGVTGPNIEIVATFEKLNVGADIYTAGYPAHVGLGEHPQFERNRPLFMKGIVSAKNYSTRRIIISTPVFGGNSGGPVWGRKSQGFGNWSVYILGVVVEWIPGFHKIGEKGEVVIIQNSGYAVVEPMDYVLELLD